MKKIFLAVDIPCMSSPPDKIEKDRMGGAERFMLLLARWLRDAGYSVSHWPDAIDNNGYDLCIHSNVFASHVPAKKNILWGGSWHVSNYKGLADTVILLSDYMRQRCDMPEAKVIPAPWDQDIECYKGFDPVPRRIVCNANPNRHFTWAVHLCRELKDKRGIDMDFHICGGSLMYNLAYPEMFDLANGHPQLIYRGILDRHAMLGMMTLGHVYAYPNFTDDCETQGVSFLEAAALGLPVVLPRRQPFLEILPEAFFGSTLEEFVDIIIKLFSETKRGYHDVSRYSTGVVMPKILKEVYDLIGD